jgi:hypothetical protein
LLRSVWDADEMLGVSNGIAQRLTVVEVTEQRLDMQHEPVAWPQ